MGLFDSIKKAFSLEETPEPTKPATPAITVEILQPRTQAVEATVPEPEVESEVVAIAVPVAETVDDEEVAPIPTVAVEAIPDQVTAVEVESISDIEPEPAVETDSEVNLASEAEVAPEVAEAPVSEAPQTETATLDDGLNKTKKTWSQRWNEFMANFRTVDEDFFEDLEETLIKADVGAQTAFQLTEELRQEAKLQNAKSREEVSRLIVEKLVEHYQEQGVDEDASMHFAPEGPTVILFVGVNGVGKTTTIGKLAARYKNEGKKVLLAAADTFRAGATQQLQVWGERDGVTVIAGKPNADPASVVYDGVRAAVEQNADILFVDTAGRLQNNVNLMEELAKMKRIIARELPHEPQEVLLVLDSTTGQNALQQAKLFKDSTDVSGIVLTKLDGTAKGGIVLPIRNELHLPVKWIGLGEQVGDLQPFDADEFAKSLFGDLLEG
ncbi:MAG: signal recognition particle-docking protein FtsY [Lactobacillaceae bacterium]|jgi:fused signal recognition particle receptor|nr:signal recognition particle-docking protein FtsY [Lactobacillaceae bacterium]